MKLADLAIGSEATLLKFLPGAKPYRRKLLAMGLTPGTPVKLLRIAPLGDPMEIKVRGFTLSLRRQEALQLAIEKIKP